MNKVILVGRLTKDPELRRTSSDIPFVLFTVAINRTYVNKAGERQTDFINCVAWRNQAENLARYQRKGNLVGVEGSLQTRSYDDPNGVRRFVTEVVCDNVQFWNRSQLAAATIIRNTMTSAHMMSLMIIDNTIEVVTIKKKVKRREEPV